MDAWEQWSALLLPHPKPHLFSRKRRLYRLSVPSLSESSMYSLSHGTRRRGTLKKPRRSSSRPPEIQPLSFEHEPMTSTIFDFFPLHDTNNVNDNVHFFTPNSLGTTPDKNLKSQPRGTHISLSQFITILILSFHYLGHAHAFPSTNTHFPHAIITSVSQSISPTIVGSNSSLIAVPMPSNAINTATGQSQANFFSSLFCSNPLGFISRKLTKLSRTTRFPNSASTPLIPSEATPTINTLPNSFAASMMVPNYGASKSIPVCSTPIPALPPPTLIAIDDFHSVACVADNIPASSTVSVQPTFQCFQAEISDPAFVPSPVSDVAIPIAHVPNTSSAFEANGEFPQLPQGPVGRLVTPNISLNLN